MIDSLLTRNINSRGLFCYFCVYECAVITCYIVLPTEAESVAHIDTQLKKTYSCKVEVNELFSQAGSKSLVIPKVEHKAHHPMMNCGSIKTQGADAIQQLSFEWPTHFLNNKVHRKCEKMENCHPTYTSDFNGLSGHDAVYKYGAIC